MGGKRRGKLREAASPVESREGVLSPVVYWPAFLAAFTLPNLVIGSGAFFQPLHIMKWTFSLAPVALMGALAGFRLLRRGTKAARFNIDWFGLVWLLLLAYVSTQPLWLKIRSPETFYREWFFFASLWLVYVLSRLLADKRLLNVLIWGALVNAGVNALFAELQVRGASDLFFFIANSGGQPLGNTGQQNMFALWMAIAGIGAVHLILSGREEGRGPVVSAVLWLLTAMVIHGLIGSTSRSGLLALTTGMLVLAAFHFRRAGRRALPVVLCTLMLLGGLTALEMATDEKTALMLTEKLGDVITNPLSLANRDSIWATSWTMFTLDPWKGVGLGQYKWHYLDAQREMLLRWPGMKFQYTHWAHNEFLQWMAEGGVVGAILMFVLWGWWGASLVRAFFRRTALSYEAIWGSALVAAFLSNAMWTRPFHRIENALWLALAFAVSNRELLVPQVSFPRKENARWPRALGGVMCAACVGGLVFLGNGVYGDWMLAKAMRTGDGMLAKEYFGRAYACPMVRDEAERRICYFSVEIGEAAGRPEMIIDGLNALIRYVEKKPDTEDIFFLKEWAKKLNDPGLNEYMDDFLVAWPEGN